MSAIINEFDSIITFESIDNILVGTYHAEVIDINVARKAVEARLQLTQNQDFAVVVDYSKVKYTNKEARDFFAKDPIAKQGIKAMGLVINSIVGRMTLNFFVFFSRPDYPTHAFSNVDEAVHWAKKQA